MFKKVAIFTDIHWGLRNDSELHNQDCLEFIEWFVRQVKKNDCDTVIFMGDWYHNRVRTENRTGHYSRIGMEILDGLNLPIYWLLGNHELYLRNSRDIHSLHNITKYWNIHLIDSVMQIGEVVFAPWLVGDEQYDLVNREVKYVFGHFELPFFLMNQVIEKVYDGHGLHIDDFTNCEVVYSGHFHKRQVRLNSSNIPIYYIGNCFGHDMNDVNDPDRGMAILEWGETIPQFIRWPDAPTYHRYRMSEFVDTWQTKKIQLKPRATLELIDDLDTPNDTIAELKSMLNYRKVTIRKPKTESAIDESSDPIAYQSLDEMIETKLQNMTYDSKFDPKLLIHLYRSV